MGDLVQIIDTIFMLFCKFWFWLGSTALFQVNWSLKVSLLKEIACPSGESEQLRFEIQRFQVQILLPPLDGLVL